MSWKRFRIEQFGGLVTGTPRGTSPMQFRALEGFTRGVMPGGLSIDRGLTVKATMSTGTFERVIAISTSTSYEPTLYVQNAAGDVYSFPSPYATRTLEFLGNNSSTLRALAGSTIGVTSSGATSDVATDAAAYNANFVTPSRVSCTTTDGGTLANTIAFVADSLGSGWQTGGTYNIVVIPVVAVNDDNASRFVWARDPRVTPFSLAAPTAAASRLDISWSGASADAVSVLVAHSNDAYYTSAGLFSSSPAVIYGPPIETRSYKTEPERLSRARGNFVVSRQGRTWLAGNASRDYSLEAPADQNPSAGNNTGRAL